MCCKITEENYFTCVVTVVLWYLCYCTSMQGRAVVGLNQHKIWYSKVLLVNRRADLGTALFFENLGRYFWGPHAEAQNYHTNLGTAWGPYGDRRDRTIYLTGAKIFSQK